MGHVAEAVDRRPQRGLQGAEGPPREPERRCGGCRGGCGRGVAEEEVGGGGLRGGGRGVADPAEQDPAPGVGARAADVRARARRGRRAGAAARAGGADRPAGADRGAGDAAVPAPEPSPEPVLPSKPRPRSAALSHLRASASARRGLVHGNSAGSAHQAAPHHSVSGALPTQTPEAQPRPLSPRKSQIEHETLLDAMSDMAIDELVREVKGLVRELSEAPPSAERTDDAAHGARKHRTRLVERLERGRGLLQEEKARREGDRKAPGPGAPSPSADAAPAEGADAAPAGGADAAPAEGRPR
ncbi:unnamed protein product [Pedinophyceae sp. YPF-701]|nr:unnamed protein product [Pedinophyceae sp. YPF-701]